MKGKLFTVSALSLAIAASAGFARADDQRYIIQVDNAHKGIVKALANKLGAEVNVDADGFSPPHSLARIYHRSKAC